MKEKNRKIRKMIMIKIDSELWRNFKAYCVINDISMANKIEEIVNNLLHIQKIKPFVIDRNDQNIQLKGKK